VVFEVSSLIWRRRRGIDAPYAAAPRREVASPVCLPWVALSMCDVRVESREACDRIGI
jgi:hypothetical protein